MKKGNMRGLLTYRPIFLLLILTVSAFTQTPDGVWEDGTPLFTKTIPGAGVLIKDIITLDPQYAVSGADETLNYILSGLEWTWPSSVSVVSAEDIDSRQVGDQVMYLVTDGLGRRVLEINSRTNSETFTFPPKQSASDPTDPKYLNKPVDAFIVTENTLFKVVITDQDRNRVIKVNKETSAIEWQYGDANYREGNGFNQLKQPEDAERIPSSKEYIIADKGNNRVIIVDEDTNNILWQLGVEELNSPVDIQYVANGKVLITDRGNHRVILVDRASKNIVWQFGRKGIADSLAGGLKLPSDADYLANGNVMIADGGNNRIIEVNSAGEIVWQFHRRLTTLRDVDRLEDGRTLVVYDNYPSRLAYNDSLMVSGVYDFGENKESVFDQLFWSADTVANVTSVQMQLRAANSLADLSGAKWFGPTGQGTFYTRSGMAANPIHDGYRFYQFRALLHTNDPLQTPRLTNVQVKHHYYNTTQQGYFYTPVIGAADGSILAKWKTLTFQTILPTDPVKRDRLSMEVRIHDAKTFERLERIEWNKVTSDNLINLENIASLNGVQSIYLLIYMSTLNASVSPILDSWKVTYQTVPSANSGIQFTDEKGFPASYYRATTVMPAQENKVDSCYVLLKDADLESFQKEYTVKIVAQKSRDSLETVLTLQPLGGFFSKAAIPLLIKESKDVDNQILEVWDRDILTIRYQDNINPADISRDSILVVQNTLGELTIENAEKVVQKTTNFGQLLYFHIKNEHDRNVNPAVQEIITLTVYDHSTGDEEVVTLSELQNASNRYDTGEFISTTGLLVTKDNNGTRRNNRIESLAGHRITAEYTDNLPLTASVTIPEDTSGNGNGDINIYFGAQPYIVEVAPNPYYRDRNYKFSLRVASSTGSLNVRKIEIFNLAGELVHEIPGAALDFDSGLPVPQDTYGIAEAWWDLKNSSGQTVSSGTYWAKVHADLKPASGGPVEQVAFFRKFVVLL